MIIRPAELADINTCLDIDHTCYTDHVWQMKVEDGERKTAVTFDVIRIPRRMKVEYPRDVQQLVGDWQRNEGFLVADLEGEVAGYIDVIDSPWQKTAWIVNLAVDPEQRRQGVGKALVLNVRQWARGQGLRALMAEATTKNYPALCFFQKLGFQFCGFNDHYYTNEDIALHFVHPLR